MCATHRQTNVICLTLSTNVRCCRTFIVKFKYVLIVHLLNTCMHACIDNCVAEIGDDVLWLHSYSIVDCLYVTEEQLSK